MRLNNAVAVHPLSNGIDTKNRNQWEGVNDTSRSLLPVRGQEVPTSDTASDCDDNQLS